MGYLLTIPVLWSHEPFGVQKGFLLTIKRVSCRYCTASMSGFIATYFYAKFQQFWPRRNFPFWGALKTEVSLEKKSWIADILTVCSCHVTYVFQSESTLYCCLKVKELLARSRREIWSLSDCNWTRTQNHLVRKRTINYLTKMFI